MSRALFCAVVVMLVAATQAPGKPGLPAQFPEVALAPGSEPHYGVMLADPFTNQYAFVLFDGSRKSGYGRMYVWVPGDPKYGKPVEGAADIISMFNDRPEVRATMDWRCRPAQRMIS